MNSAHSRLIHQTSAGSHCDPGLANPCSACFVLDANATFRLGILLANSDDLLRARLVNAQYAPSLLKMTLNVFSKIKMSSASEQSLA